MPNYLQPFKPVWAAVVTLVGGLWWLANFLFTVQGLMGLPPVVWHLAGPALFMAGILAILYHALSRINAGQTSPPPPIKTTTTKKQRWWRRQKEAQSDVQLGAVLSHDDKDAMARMRQLWIREDGQLAVNAVSRLVREAIDTEPLKSKYYAAYLEPIATELDAAVSGFEGELDATVSLERVVEMFNRLHAVYLIGAKVLYQMHQAGDIDLRSAPLLNRYNYTLDRYKLFRERLLLAASYKGLIGRLKVIWLETGQSVPARQFFGEQPWDGKPPTPLAG